MWLWTISTGAMNGNGEDEEGVESEGTREEEEPSLKPAKLTGFDWNSIRQTDSPWESGRILSE
jgi:hypothetical protein